MAHVVPASTVEMLSKVVFQLEFIAAANLTCEVKDFRRAQVAPVEGPAVGMRVATIYVGSTGEHNKWDCPNDDSGSRTRTAQERHHAGPVHPRTTVDPRRADSDVSPSMPEAESSDRSLQTIP